MSLVNNDKLLIEMDKSLIKKNIRVSLIYGIPALIIAVFLAYLTVSGFGLLIALLCIMLLILCGTCAYSVVMNIKHLKSGKPLLEADIRGISEDSILMRGFVPWSGVKKIYMKQTSLNGKNLEYIELELFDKDSYINSLNAAERKIVQSNMAMGHEAAFLIFSSSLYKVDTEEILNDLIYLWERNR